MTKICINNNLFFIGMGIILLIILFNKNDKQCPPCIKPEKILNINNQTKDLKYYYDKKKELNRKSLEDPMHPPTRLYQNRYYVPEEILSISTRGIQTQWQYIGNLKNGSDKIFQVMGRRKYPNSREWEYYVNDLYNKIKVNINTINDKENYNRELYDNDTITIKEYGDTKFTFYKNDINNDVYKYNPHLL